MLRYKIITKKLKMTHRRWFTYINENHLGAVLFILNIQKYKTKIKLYIYILCSSILNYEYCIKFFFHAQYL